MKYKIIAHTPQGKVESEIKEASEVDFYAEKNSLEKISSLYLNQEDGFFFLPEGVFKQSVIGFEIISE